MRKYLLLLLSLFFAGAELAAQPARIVVKGAERQVWVYNQERGRDRKAFVDRDFKGKTSPVLQTVTVPEEECRGLLFLIADNRISWLQALPGETVKVDVDRKDWHFAGDGRQVNRYLYGWTRDFWQGRPNALLSRCVYMYMGLDEAMKRYPTPEELCRAENMDWLEGLEEKSLEALDKAGLKDREFVRGQKRRIHYCWMDMILNNYVMVSSRHEVPVRAFRFLDRMHFDNADLLDYPGCDDVVSDYVRMVTDAGRLSYTAKDHLRVKARLFDSPEIREYYVLRELDATVNRACWLYQTDELMESVRDMVISPAGKARYGQIRSDYGSLLQSPENTDGQPVINAEFEGLDGQPVRLSDFRGSYLFIDMWATWCGPCKYQIPYLKKLEDELKGYDIRFLALSTDRQKDKDKWKALVRQFGLAGGHNAIVRDAGNNPMRKAYRVTGIPRFMLVDPEGVIVMSRARRPSDPVLKLQLLDILDAHEHNKVRISGTAAGVQAGTVCELIKTDGMSRIVQSVPVKDGKFSMVLPPLRKGYYFITCGKGKSEEIWLEPGASLHVAFGSPTRYAGKLAGFNQMVGQVRKMFNAGVESLDRVLYDSRRGTALRKIYDSAVAAIRASGLPDGEKEGLLGYAQGCLFDHMFKMIGMTKVFGKIPGHPVVRKGYSDAVMDIGLVPALARYPQFHELLQEYLYARMERGDIRITDPDSWLASLSSGIGNAELREDYQMAYLNQIILQGYVRNIENQIASVRPGIRKEVHLRQLARMPGLIARQRDRFAAVPEGTDMGGFEFEDASGRTVKLSSFRGKYIFMDIWSTGCNPCVGEIPYMKEMARRLSGRPFAFVSLSVDTRRDVWKKFLQEKGMKGNQLICPKAFKHPFMQKIGLTGIPRFVLLDKEGKIVDPSTFRPSNPVLGELLRMME